MRQMKKSRNEKEGEKEFQAGKARHGDNFMDIVVPHGNERDFISMASRLSISKLCFLYPLEYFSGSGKSLPSHPHLSAEANEKGVEIFFGALANDRKSLERLKSQRSQKAKSPSAPQPFFISAFRAQPQGTEEPFRSRQLDMVFGLESLERKDSLHFRRSGLNHVLCSLAKSSNVSVAFSFSDILSSSGMLRGMVLGRMRQNIMLCRKYRVPMLIASFSSGPYGMRPLHELLEFFHVIGMSQGEAVSSTENSLKILTANLKKAGPNYISEGMELV